MFLIGGLTILVCAMGDTWPAVKSTVWFLFLGSMAACLYFDLREPVNYVSLQFDAKGFRHERIGPPIDVLWSDVEDVFYIRSFEPFTNDIETEWQFQLKSGESVMVLVEWPHRKPFARAVAANLGFASEHIISNVHRLRGEGRWRCVEE